MRGKTWAAAALALGGVFSVLMAVWPGGMIEDGVQRASNNPQWWFTAHMIAGSLGVFGILVANQRPMLARIAAGIGSLALLSILVTEPIHGLNILTSVVPAIAMAGAAFALNPAPGA